MTNKYFLIIAILAKPIFACTGFICGIKAVHAFDWTNDMVRVAYTPAGVEHSSDNMIEDNFNWNARFASFGFTQFADSLPQSGMNEKGLAVLGLMQNDATYPSLIDKLKSINELAFIQYALDNCETVSEVLDAIQNEVQIAKIFVPMHYLVFDHKGDLAIIEFIDGEVVVINGPEIGGPEFKVLTNNTYYSNLFLAQNTEQKIHVDEGRFLAAVNALRESDNVDEIFDRIKRPLEGTIFEMWKDAEFLTRWKVVFNVETKEIKISLLNKNVRQTYSFAEAPLTSVVMIADPSRDGKFHYPSTHDDNDRTWAIAETVGKQIVGSFSLNRVRY